MIGLSLKRAIMRVRNGRSIVRLLKRGWRSLLSSRRRCGVSERVAYEYAVVRIVPRVDRDEFVNAGVIVFAKQHKLLASRTRVDEDRLRALWPAVDLEAVRRHLDAVD